MSGSFKTSTLNINARGDVEMSEKRTSPESTYVSSMKISRQGVIINSACYENAESGSSSYSTINVNGQGVILNSASYGNAESGSSSYSTINVNGQGVILNSVSQRSTMLGSSVNSMPREDGQDVFRNASYQGRTVVGSSNKPTVNTNGQGVNSFCQRSGVFGSYSNLTVGGNITINGNILHTSNSKLNSGTTQSGISIGSSFHVNKDQRGPVASFMTSGMRISVTGFKTLNMRVSNLRGSNKRKKLDDNRRF